MFASVPAPTPSPQPRDHLPQSEEPARGCRSAGPRQGHRRQDRRRRRPRRRSWPSQRRGRPGSSGCATACRARRRNCPSIIAGVFTKRRLDEDTLQDLEDVLIRADLGIETALRVTDALAASRYGRDVSDAEVRAIMAEEIEKVLAPVALPLELDLSHKPHVILVVGVNGTGKTTTIGKLAAKLRRRRAEGDAGRRRHVPRRGDRAAEDLGRAHRRAGRRLEARRRRRRPCLRRVREGQGRRLRRAHHRHGRPAAEQGRADGRARKDRARARQARPGGAAHGAADASTPRPARTRSTRSRSSAMLPASTGWS